MLRSVWGAYCEGEAGPPEVLEVIDRVVGFLHFELESLEQQAQAGIAHRGNPTFMKIQRAFQLHLEAMDIMAEEFESVEAPGTCFVEGFELALEATAELIDAHHSALAHIQAMAQVDCMFCGHSNSRDQQRCGKCGRTLGGSEGKNSLSVVQQEGLESQTPPVAVTGNYVRVAQTVEAWRQGQCKDDQLLQVMQEVEERLLGHLQECDTYPPEQVAEEVLQATRLGLAQSLDALDTMRLAFEKEDDSYLSNGLAELQNASSLLVDAYHQSKPNS